MQAITTKYLPCTPTKPQRIKADFGDKSITVNWDYSLEVAPNHIAAAKALIAKLSLGWTEATGFTDKEYVHIYLKGAE
jgi:hypothetical protein